MSKEVKEKTPEELAEEAEFAKQRKEKREKKKRSLLERVAAIVCLVLIVFFIVGMIVSAFVGSKYFVAFLFGAIVIPFVIYIFVWLKKISS